MCDRYHFGLVGCKIVKYISRYWQPCKSIAAAWRPDPANHASARDHAPLPRQPPLHLPEPPVGHVSPGHINMCGWGGKDGPVERRMERIFTKRRLDTRWRGCRDENEIRKRERCSSTTARTFVKSTHSLNSSDVMKITMQFGPLVTFHTTPWPSLKLIRAPPSNLLVNFAKKKNFTKFNPWSSLSLIHFYKSNLKVS